ncbi:MAG TPA: hypothetical protein VF744_09260 [Beijerinckiaceae bacterium]|jgi:hypothetical protein
MIAGLRAILARSLHLMRRQLPGLVSGFVAAWLAVGPAHAAPGGSQDRPAPDCLLTYAEGQLCGRTSIHDAFKCVAFPRGEELLSVGADTCVASKDRRETCRIARIPSGRVFLDTMTVRRAEIYCPDCVVPLEQRMYDCLS